MCASCSVRKPTRLVILLSLLAAVWVPIRASDSGKKPSARSELYRYEDTAGRLFLVDDLNKVPERYRDRVQHIRFTQDEFRLMNQLTKVYRSAADSSTQISRLYLAFLYLDPMVLAWWGLLLAFLFLPLVAKHPISRLNILLAGLILLVVTHVAVVAPHMCMRARSFHQSWQAASRFALSPQRQARLDTLLFFRCGEPLPLNPFAFHGRMLTMATAYRRMLSLP